MSGNPRTGIVSIEDCINVCNAVHGCKGLTFKAETERCWLKSVHFTPLTSSYITGFDSVTGSLNMDCLFGKPGKTRTIKQ